MPYRIFEWEEIAQNYYGGSLLLGNGASMAVDERFGYTSLIDYARERGLFTNEIKQLFNFFSDLGLRTCVTPSMASF